MKTCSKCHTNREFSEFAFSKNRPDGREPYCKLCRNAYYHENKERFRKKRAEFYQENRDRIRQEVNEYRRRPDFAEKLRKWHRDYRGRRFFFVRAQALKIRAKNKAEVATIAEVSRLWKQQHGVCPLSGRRLDRANAQLDHIVPLTRGGSDLKENLRWVHRDVNYAKRDLFDADFFRLCSDVVNQLRPRQ